MHIFFAIIFVSVSKVADTCISSGVCGGGGIGTPGLGPACFPPPAPISCQPPCPPGYQCGPYGCARAQFRAHGSNTLVQMDGKPIGNEQRNPNELFMECCRRRQLPDACLSKCTFNTYTKQALLDMWSGRDACPIRASAELQFCAAQGGNHVECCRRNGVATTLAGEKCLVFCDQRPGNVTQLDVSYLSCYDRFESMKTCFWHGIISPQL
ncbi:hypothetical protein AB6A40_000808 [Gnathostoma spinigerum]|uniref:Domain of unknown function DB domain-containing protein n=1 Tax=Gnathostoma spinigerum TaxID=75299 RepID=A0ABD6E2S8_9BILA